jgi:multidrug resistance efflux pump
VVRTDSPGFVQEVSVCDGQMVIQDQVLVVMDNPQLNQQLADLELAIRGSEVMSRILYQENELAKYLVEKKDRQSLVAKRDELRRQVAALTLRAESAGRVMARDLDTLVGQYLETGTSVMALGLEEKKELRASVDQSDVEAFRRGQGSLVRARVRGTPRPIAGARILRVHPQATPRLLHPAFGAPLRGPLTVTTASAEANSTVAIREHYELVKPRFTAIVQLPPEECQDLKAGRLANVRLGRTGESVGGHIQSLLRSYIDKRMGRPGA